MGEGDLAAMDTVLAGRLQAHSRVWVYRTNPTLYYHANKQFEPTINNKLYSLLDPRI